MTIAVFAGVATVGPAAAASTTGPIPRVAAMSPRWLGAEGEASAATGRYDFFNGDSCTSSAFCMAVGGYSLGGHSPGLSETLTAGTWVAEPVPSPSRGVNIFANEVSCAAPANCLFVGDHWAGQHGLAANLAEAWNGHSWRIVAAANPAGAATSGLDDVACPTRKFCLAVGWAGSARIFQDAGYTWTNGRTWRKILTPKPGHASTSELGGLACSNSGNCMAVGNYTRGSSKDLLPFAARYHNGRWTLLTMATIRGHLNPAPQGVSCPTATRCIAVGYAEDNSRGRYFHAFAEIWNGGTWHVSTLRPSVSVFIGISCAGRDRCFAVGYVYPSLSGFAHSLIDTWNGRTWTTQYPVTTPKPYSGGDLLHVSCLNSSDCEAVGERFELTGSQNSQTLAQRWNGHHWTVQTTVNP